MFHSIIHTITGPKLALFTTSLLVTFVGLANL